MCEWRERAWSWRRQRTSMWRRERGENILHNRHTFWVAKELCQRSSERALRKYILVLPHFHEKQLENCREENVRAPRRVACRWDDDWKFIFDQFFFMTFEMFVIFPLHQFADPLRKHKKLPTILCTRNYQSWRAIWCRHWFLRRIFKDGRHVDIWMNS